MKKLCALLASALLFSGNALMAQETVAPQAKKLQQLYVSVGTGPAITSHDLSRPNGGIIQVNLTGGIASGYLVRAGFQNAGYIYGGEPASSTFNFLQQYNYNSRYYPSNTVKSLSLAGGKAIKLNPVLQFQGLTGFSYNNIVSVPMGKKGAPVNYPPLELICDREFYNAAGLIFQAEAMFLLTRFAGLTLSGYYHYIPKISNGGITLSLNLGLLK